MTSTTATNAGIGALPTLASALDALPLGAEVTVTDTRSVALYVESDGQYILAGVPDVGLVTMSAVIGGTEMTREFAVAGSFVGRAIMAMSPDAFPTVGTVIEKTSGNKNADGSARTYRTLDFIGGTVKSRRSAAWK